MAASDAVFEQPAKFSRLRINQYLAEPGNKGIAVRIVIEDFAALDSALDFRGMMPGIDELLHSACESIDQ